LEAVFDAVVVDPLAGEGPKLDVASDADPREFLLDVETTRFDEPILVEASYYACHDEEGWCRAVRQSYTIDLEVDPDAGSVIRKAEHWVADPAAPKKKQKKQ
jgi:hypothetical protein